MHKPIEKKRAYFFAGIQLFICVILFLSILGVWLYYHYSSASIYHTLTAHKDKKVTSQTSSKFMAPTTGAYTGVFLGSEEESDKSTAENNVTLDCIENFESMVGKHQALIAFSSFWGEQNFPTEAATIVMRHHCVPLIFWSPWDAPYEQNHGPDRFSLEKILAGQWDTYIDAWADKAKELDAPLCVSFGNEMNGDWFPWSGYYNGAEDPAKDGNGHAGPETFKSAYRYVVDRVRKRAATNVLWVFHVNNFSAPEENWNAMKEYYPGDDYVDWLGVSVYGQQFPHTEWKTFHSVFSDPYTELASVTPEKPIMITELGVGEFPHESGTIFGGDKGAWITDALKQIETQYPRVHAVVYWNERWQNPSGEYSNLRVNSSPAAITAYKEGIAGPFWLDQPILQ